MTEKINEKERDSSFSEDEVVTGQANPAGTGEGSEQEENNPEMNHYEADSESNPDSELVASLRMQLQDSVERLARGQADFDNFRRRTRQEKEEFAKYASAKLIEQLLPVVDNFERAVSAGREAMDFDSLFKGVEMIARQLNQVLEQEGLTPMDAVGQPFNPEYHQALMQVESEEHEEGVVVEEMVKGYMLKDKVLRPAMVKVSG